MDNKERFISLCKRVNRDGIDDLLEWLEKSDFYTCPASTRFHGSYKGGLLEHSLNVYDECQRLLKVYPINVSEESVIIACCFHDLCKVNVYTTEIRNRKDEHGRWESYEAYKFAEKFSFGGHGSKSVFLVQNFIKLTPEEAVAINCHMGTFEQNANTLSVSDAFNQFPFAWLVSVADQSASFFIEGKDK